MDKKTEKKRYFVNKIELYSYYLNEWMYMIKISSPNHLQISQKHKKMDNYGKDSRPLDKDIV